MATHVSCEEADAVLQAVVALNQHRLLQQVGRAGVIDEARYVACIQDQALASVKGVMIGDSTGPGASGGMGTHAAGQPAAGASSSAADRQASNACQARRESSSMTHVYSGRPTTSKPHPFWRRPVHR